MKKILLLLYFVCLAIAAGAQDNYEPKADPKAVVESRALHGAHTADDTYPVQQGTEV